MLNLKKYTATHELLMKLNPEHVATNITLTRSKILQKIQEIYRLIMSEKQKDAELKRFLS